MKIKGEYEVTFLIQNMFNSYTLTTREHNIVTDEGLNLILNILANNTNKKLGKVYVGKNSIDPSTTDTVSILDRAVSLNHKIPLKVKDNTLTYDINTDGNNINETCEIGIRSDDNTILITRDVHDTYDVPTNAVINIKYSLTLTNKNSEELINND